MSTIIIHPALQLQRWKALVSSWLARCASASNSGSVWPSSK